MLQIATLALFTISTVLLSRISRVPLSLGCLSVISLNFLLFLVWRFVEPFTPMRLIDVLLVASIATTFIVISALWYYWKQKQ